MQASSGKITRHRLNCGANRPANHALWRIAIVRLATDADTRAYADRRQAEGKTRRDIIRCLKRYIAREVHTLLTNPHPAADTSDLRKLRQRANRQVWSLATRFHTCRYPAYATNYTVLCCEPRCDTKRHRTSQADTAGHKTPTTFI